MKQFHFRLEQVLSLRKHVEREWELKLAEPQASITGDTGNETVSLQA